MAKFDDSREKRAKLNIVVSLLCQVATLVCGLIGPRLIISHYGSEAYGATTSITQFLAYITLLEGGIGGVARAALYKPLSSNNIQVVTDIVNEIRQFFKTISYAFIVYTILLACVFKMISGIECFDWATTFLLVIVISISTFAQYYIGISYSVLIQASQRTYITNFINISTTILNTILIVFFVNIGSSLLFVKLVSSCVFVLRPLLMQWYIKKIFPLTEPSKCKQNYLSQKWEGLGQHIAFFLHSNTDIAILTIFTNLKIVAIYSVYYMVVSNIERFVTSFSTGMESIFGDMLAKKEINILHKTFDKYETLVSYFATILFSTTAILIIPFIKIYTKNISDANYSASLFSIILILSSFITCLRSPYHNMIIAAGHFKQTKIAAYGEAFINIILSLILVFNFELLGVAIGTLFATGFRFLFYVFYLSKNILCRPVIRFSKRFSINLITYMLIYFLGVSAINNMDISNYFVWSIGGILITCLAIIVTTIVNFVFYRQSLISMVKMMLKKAN